MWKCNTCDCVHTNDGIDECVKCLTPKGITRWVCGRCRFHNDNNLSACYICAEDKTNRHTVVDLGLGEKTPWKCSRCKCEGNVYFMCDNPSCNFTNHAYPLSLIPDKYAKHTHALVLESSKSNLNEM